MIGLYLAAALAAVMVPALMVWIAVTISDALQARHDAADENANADRAVDWDGLIGVQHTDLITRKDGL